MGVTSSQDSAAKDWPEPGAILGQFELFFFFLLLCLLETKMSFLATEIVQQ